MLGNFLGDFVTGNVQGRFPPEVVQGIMNHRKVDHFTDSNAIVLTSKSLISRPRRRLAGIIIDVLYDHFLSRNWSLYSGVDASEFIRNAYDTLSSHAVKIPPRAEFVIAKLIEEDWLSAYGTMEGIDTTFRRMSKRLKRENSLSSAVEELETHYDQLNLHFLRFFPELMDQMRRI